MDLVLGFVVEKFDLYFFLKFDDFTDKERLRAEQDPGHQERI